MSKPWLDLGPVTHAPPGLSHKVVVRRKWEGSHVYHLEDTAGKAGHEMN